MGIFLGMGINLVTIILTRFIKFIYNNAHNMKVVEKTFATIDNEFLHVVLNELYDKNYETLQLKDVIPFINIILALKSANDLSKNEELFIEDMTLAFEMYENAYPEEEQAEDDDIKDITDLILDSPSYFVRFTHESKFNTIFFKIIKDHILVEDANGWISTQSEDFQKEQILKILYAISIGDTKDYGFSETLEDIIYSPKYSEMFNDIEEPEMVRKRVLK